ncbi:MAG: NTP transferase domain-containing protein [Bacteroidota bacterium]
MPVPLICLAAGRSTRFGTLKQVAPVGPSGASILAYTVVDALLAGFTKVVLVVRPEIESEIREHLDRQLGTDLPIRFVHQLEALGTGHAALLGLAGIEGPAAIANGDDAYGRDALKQLNASAEWVANSTDGLARCTLVAYPILGTLSEHGGVSRGWVQTEGDTVTAIDEIVEVRSGPGGRQLEGLTTAGRTCVMPRDALGSMNLWMLGPGVHAPLRRAFETYQRHPDAKEFYLSTALDRLRAANKLAIRVAGTADGWFGLTFADDLPAATARLAEAHRAGSYADSLASMVDPFRT